MRNSKLVVTGSLVIFLAASCLLGVHKLRAESELNSDDSGRARIVTVVKRTGIVWFERMEQGIKKFAAQNGVDASMTGAADADPQKQAEIIRKLIAEKPNAITVVPNSPAALEAVL